MLFCCIDDNEDDSNGGISMLHHHHESTVSQISTGITVSDVVFNNETLKTYHTNVSVDDVNHELIDGKGSLTEV